MKNKPIAIMTAIAMVVSLLPTFAFAVESAETIPQQEPEVVLADADDVEDIIENVVETDDVLDSVKDEGDFVVEGEDSEIVIPEDGSGIVSIESCNEETISMSLPDEFSDIKGALTVCGTIVYAEDETDAALAVQAVREEQGEICLDGFRSLVTIENAQASHNYSFRFNLPEDAKLIKDGEYIYIVNENNVVTDEKGENTEPELIGVIEPAWAKDANGESVNTHYSIDGNILTQTVDFDKGSTFPIVADPRFTTVKKYWKTISGTKYNKSTAAKSTKKCNWKAKIYRYYYKNVGTGKLNFRYKEYDWLWKGYKKINGKWKYVTSKSGKTRKSSGPDNIDDWYVYLATIGEF